MDKEKITKSKKIRIIKIIIVVAAGAGLLFMLYSSIVNTVVGAKQARVLAEWEDRQELSEEGMEQVGPVEGSETASENTFEGENERSEGTTGQSASSNASSAKIGKVTVDYRDLTAKDFFPLKMSIPKIDLEQISYEGADPQTLMEGPGHIGETPLPGSIGRCTISGHRTTYGSPFRRIDELENGDLIYLETIKGELFVYVVTGREVVNPKDVYILNGSYRKELLLTTCEPEYSSAKRLIIIAELLNLYPLELASAGDKK